MVVGWKIEWLSLVEGTARSFVARWWELFHHRRSAEVDA